jgi:formate-dependent nitrite reductase cytochrome c552 subunit
MPARLSDGYLLRCAGRSLSADGQIDGKSLIRLVPAEPDVSAGVTCSDCHTQRQAAEGKCATTSMPEKFDVAEHHHHQPGSTGAQCVNCHMPTKTYMVVDVRRDHSIRVPRPDLSVALGMPNACTQCHAQRSAEWAAQSVADWFPHGRQTASHYGTAVHAGRIGTADAEQQLDRLILDQSQPIIARTTALPLLAPDMTPASEPAIKAAIADADPLVRSRCAVPCRVLRLGPSFNRPLLC